MQCFGNTYRNHLVDTQGNLAGFLAQAAWALQTGSDQGEEKLHDEVDRAVGSPLDPSLDDAKDVEQVVITGVPVLQIAALEEQLQESVLHALPAPNATP